MPKGYLPYSRGASVKMFMTSRLSVVKKHRAALTRNSPKNTAAPHNTMAVRVRTFPAVQATPPEQTPQISITAPWSTRASIWGRMSWHSTWNTRGPGPDQDPVELGLGQHLGEAVEPPGEALRQRGGQQNHRVAQRELGQGVAPHGPEPVQKEHHPQKDVHRAQHGAETAQKEGAFVGHDGLEMDRQKFEIEFYGTHNRYILP